MPISLSEIRSRRDRIASIWDDVLSRNEVVVIYSGSLIQKPGGLDQHYPFLVYPDYYWLTGRKREEEAILYNKDCGWVLFQKQIGPEEVVWEGERTDFFFEEEGIGMLQLNGFLISKKFEAVIRIGQMRTHLSKRGRELKILLDQTRRKKDPAEIKLIRSAAGFASAGYKSIAKIIQPGVSEKELQIAYESAVWLHGDYFLPYDTIIGSGTNSSILHSIPSGRVVEANEFVLVDAGASFHGYNVDVTRVYASDRDMDSRHNALYDLVLATQKNCVTMLRPGLRWRDVHAKAAVQFTEGLHFLGLIKGSISELLEREIVSLFFPHGIGHLTGLGVRDTGQIELDQSTTCYGSRLRVDPVLEPGLVITVEPGLYFIEKLFKQASQQEKYRQFIDWEQLSNWICIGGVRIEDTILITQNGCENLTSDIPLYYAQN